MESSKKVESSTTTMPKPAISPLLCAVIGLAGFIMTGLTGFAHGLTGIVAATAFLLLLCAVGIFASSRDRKMQKKKKSDFLVLENLLWSLPSLPY
jgi:hypothetical protein